ncbi:hypothetical protein GHK92_02175 [Nocardioides sp. dk4132]|uniref:DUF4350 domain-containing protein n=1 Tax=unclassified Nocardioides TaxID=2615069 RepID=UPI001297B491|nr:MULTISPECIES: DUF4350 domain-containing protein [unclassified Nocardioides]MQW74669.1 hypothetical protein [Nocardioides sp. dk4132]QGA06576.1 hypothetical protein GFH29_03615 [Nocardioides sp. dk884]
MSTTPAPPATAAAPAARSRRLTWLLVAIGLLVAVAVAVLLGDGARSAEPLDPDNPDPQGAQALARVLDREGVEVVVARGADDLEAIRVDAATTVLLSRPDLLGRESTDRLVVHARDARLVVAGAGPGALSALGVEAESSSLPPSLDTEAACTVPDLADHLDGLRLEVDDARGHDLPGCFGTPSLTDEGSTTGTVISQARPGLVLVGAPDLLSNEQVLRADNAAIALRLLGREPRLVWYVPSLDDLGAEDGVALGTLLPRWVGPGLFLVLLSVLALMLWRGRRLGPLATEPLPVVVRASETVHSRGRLYRRSGDRAHAAQALREATRTALARRLHLSAGPGGVPLEELVRLVAREGGRPEADVDALIGPHAPAPTTDHDLITLAGALATLEEEVRRP